MRLSAFALVSTALVATACASHADESEVDPVKAWARQVTLGVDIGEGAGRVRRWGTSPTLSVIEGSAADRTDLEELLPVLNELVAPLSINVVADGDETASIEVYFTPLSNFDAIAAANGFAYEQGNWGYFYTSWNAERQLTKAHILLANDMLQGDGLRHFTFEETTQSLGPMADSPLIADSIFFADGRDGGSALDLSELDRRLVRLLYTHLLPGDGMAAFDSAFDAYFYE